jgi:hypothetical protein
MLDDVPTPIVARLAHRADDRMVIAHPLPFLRLSGGVRDEDGRQARIDSVRLDVQDGVSNLILDVVYEREPFMAAVHHEDTLPGFVPEGIEEILPPDLSAPRARKRRDETVPFEFHKQEPRFVVAVSDAPPALVVPTFWSRLWMCVTLWARGAEMLVDRMLAARARARAV